MTIRTDDDSTLAEKLIVCGTAFAVSCAAFFASVLVAVPTTASCCEAVNSPESVTQTLILTEILTAPTIGAFVGIALGARIIFSQRQHSESIAS